MKKLRLAGVAGLAVAASAFAASPASADTILVECPDNYEPVPTMAAPPDKQDKDNNDNGFVCAKGPLGSNEHYNVKDDKGEIVPPTVWSVTPVSWTVFLINYNLQGTGYSLDPTPTDVVDDLAP
ncbi:MAG TPA: hypothetical protein VF545_00480 [Thermoleophilaceae bacterium]|jgi:hypothetical protein